MRVLLVAGARPNFMKIAPIVHALGDSGAESVLVHTGQHYDAAMSEAFFRDLRLPAPDYNLEVGSDTHARQTARVMERFEPVLTDVAPDWVVVVGDVNSTLACALVAAKLRHQIGCRIAHVEAGLRSGDWRMPEEVNRVLTDRLSDLLLTPSEDARDNLLREGIDDEQIVFVGNVMIDSLCSHLPAASDLRAHRRHGIREKDYALVTLHRPSNVDNAEQLRVILEAFEDLSRSTPVVFPVHPRTRSKMREYGFDSILDKLIVIDPVSYVEMVSYQMSAAVVVTDSGGIQEETTALGVPCVTLREQTERPITLTQGTNRLAPWPLARNSIVQTCQRAMEEKHDAPPRPRGWDGAAAIRIVEALRERTFRGN